MTAYAPEHTPRTRLLVHCVSRGCSWLGHSRLGGELDWALLRGATDQELADIRRSWRGHIQHLEQEHRLSVLEHPAGVWKIVAAAPPAAVSTGEATPRCDREEIDDDEADDDDGAAPYVASPIGGLNLRFVHTARAIMALHQARELTNPLHKDSVGMLIRQASEGRHWHDSAHYRSRAAAALIAAANPAITTKSQYQAFCSSNLRHEHMVPNSVLYQMIIANPEPTEPWIVDLFDRLSKRATITRAQDTLLRRSTMPDGFGVPGHRYDHPLARYDEAGLLDDLDSLPARGAWFIPAP